jgi:2-dehydro-3-deoxygluconokinase
MNKFDLVGLGEAMVEFNQFGPREFQQGFGGDTSNCIIAASRMGARTAYLTRLGNDSFGDALMQLWADENVDTSQVARDTEHDTAIYFVTHSQEGHQFSYRRKNSAASQMDSAWATSQNVGRVLINSRILHVSGISIAISDTARAAVRAAVLIAKRGGAKLSLDLNFRGRLWTSGAARTAITELLPKTDYFFAGLDEMETVFGCKTLEQCQDWAAAQAQRCLLLKDGARGAWLIRPRAESPALRCLHAPATVVNAIDATGAGDCFAGTFLAEICAGASEEQALHTAAKAAAISTTGKGAVAPLPYRKQIS